MTAQKCITCGGRLTNTNGGRIYCSAECSYIVNSAREKERKAAVRDGRHTTKPYTAERRAENLEERKELDKVRLELFALALHKWGVVRFSKGTNHHLKGLGIFSVVSGMIGPPPLACRPVLFGES